ncbi:MAG TPA: MFS transporter [Blastocatellia bacterium]|nr:MFS transporter [Blastocatellia bacterium]
MSSTASTASTRLRDLDSPRTLESVTTLSLLNLLRLRPALRGFITVCGIAELNAQMLNVAISWYVYSSTHDPMSLAYIGLARFIPNIGMVLIAGQTADRIDRRRIVALSLFLQALGIATFGAMLAAGMSSVRPVYLLLVVISSAQAFCSPAMSAMLPSLVSAEEFPRAVAVSSSAFQICTLCGPAAGGLVYALNGPGMFAFCAALYLIAITQVRRLAGKCKEPGEPKEGGAQANTPVDESPLGGIRYVRSNRLLLSLISLDLFAVLLGGITALLPIYARDILHAGPAALGCLRCAPGIGAAIIGLILAHRVIRRRVGKLMLGSVAGFGFATVVFSVSTNLWLSFGALVVAGGFDMVSMVIRQTLVQVSTPDAMRGRVSAVQGVFVGASSELGEFESGATAALFGTVPAALLGGLGTLAVVALWTGLFPELPRADKLVMEGTNDGGVA